MVLMATVGIAVVSVMVIQAKKTAANNSIRTSADRDIEYALYRIQTILSSPASCNANFSGQPTSNASVSFINSCTSGANCGAGTAATVALPTQLTNWTMFTGDARRKARIFSISYAIPPANYQKVGAGIAAPAMLELSIVFEKNLGMNGSVITTSRTKPYILNAFVVTGILNTSTSPWSLSPTSAAATTIIGCARSPSSTIAF